MKYLVTLLVCVIAVLSINAQSVDKTKTKKIPVRGNCGMCETTIERAALSVEGVQTADWDVEQELLTIVYNPKVTHFKTVEKEVANSGYDTKRYTATKDAYDNLPGCCQYTDKKKEK